MMRPRLTSRPRIFFDAEIKANNYMYEAEAEALLLTVTARRLLVNIPHKNLENV